MKYYITTAIDYVNNLPHLGTAFEKIGADAMARWRRLLGDDVVFLMGNDEHSTNVFKAAQAEGLDPLDYCNRMEERFRAVWSRLDLSFDIFIRTTWPQHRKAVQELYRRIEAAGDIHPGKYVGPYCVSCEEYKRDADLDNGLCRTHKRKPEQVEEENYFFALSKYQKRLRDHIEANPSFIVPGTRRNEVLGWLDQGLEDISITRPRQPWGVEAPGSPDHRIYVWFDALINYITGAGFATDEARFARIWPADVHVIGKDITRFHCLIWPAMLMSAGLPPPKQVFAHGFVNVEGEKMSKSLGTTVDPVDLCDRFGADPVRYFMLREISFHGDGDFSLRKFAGRYNGDLANDLGNVVQRTITLAHKYQRGRLVRAPAHAPLRDGVLGLRERVAAAMGRWEFHRALEEIWVEVRRTNQYLEETQPWSQGKRGDAAGLAASLYNSFEAVRVIAVMLSPFMPATSAAILGRLGASLDLGATSSWEILPDGGELKAGDPLFPRLKIED